MQMQVYLTPEEMTARFNAFVDELAVIIGGGMQSMVFRTALGFIPVKSIPTPQAAAMIEQLTERLAGVYGYDVLFVKEGYRKSIEGATAAGEGEPRPLCADEEAK